VSRRVPLDARTLRWVARCFGAPKPSLLVMLALLKSWRGEEARRERHQTAA
jgi:hypothetical protein